MRANGSPRFLSRAGEGSSQKLACAGEGGAKGRETFRGEHLARARIAATPRHHFEETDGSIDPARRRDDTDFDSACAVAADADAKRCAALAHFRAKTHVGGDFVEAETSAAVKGDRDFGRDRCAERSAHQRSAQIAGERARVEHLFRIESGERVAENGNAVRRRNLQRADRRREARR